MRIFATAFLAALALYGQPGSITGPSLGFVFDSSSHALRRIQGIPGAALVGTPMDFGFPVSAAYVAPRLDSVFVVAGEGQARLFRLTGQPTGAPALVAIDSLGTPRRVVYSPSGSAAALYSPGSVRIVKGLPDAPVLAGAINLRSNPRARTTLPDTLAVSDDGAYLLYAGGSGLELITLAGNSRQVLQGGATLAAFAPGGHDAAVVDGTRLTFFQDIAGAATERSYDGIATPTALAFSPDSQKLVVASATGRKITTIQVATGERSALACDCAPSALVAMGSVFRLNELGTEEPLWVLDTASERGLLFIPVPATN